MRKRDLRTVKLFKSKESKKHFWVGKEDFRKYYVEEFGQNLENATEFNKDGPRELVDSLVTDFACMRDIGNVSNVRISRYDGEIVAVRIRKDPLLPPKTY